MWRVGVFVLLKLLSDMVSCGCDGSLVLLWCTSNHFFPSCNLELRKIFIDLEYPMYCNLTYILCHKIRTKPAWPVRMAFRWTHLSLRCLVTLFTLDEGFWLNALPFYLCYIVWFQLIKFHYIIIVNEMLEKFRHNRQIIIDKLATSSVLKWIANCVQLEALECTFNVIYWIFLGIKISKQCHFWNKCSDNPKAIEKYTYTLYAVMTHVAFRLGQY